MTDVLPTQSIPRDAARDLTNRLNGLIVEVRNRRRTLEQTWLYNHAAWRGVRLEERQSYKSDLFKHYLPAARRAIERSTVRAQQMLLPSPVFFEVYPGNEFDLIAGRTTDSVRAYMEYLLTKRINIRRVVQQLVRSYHLYARAITKTTVRESAAGQVWPTVRAVDPFSFYVWPETVTDLDDAALIFEDVMLSWQEYEAAVRRGVAKPLPRTDLSEPEWPHHVVQRLSYVGMADPSAVRGAQADETTETRRPTPRPQPFVALTEAWFKIGTRWAMAWLVWNVPEAPRLVRLHYSPYPAPPYRIALSRPLPGEHYSTSMMDDIEPLQALLNDQINQTEENRTISGLPPIALDESDAPSRDLLVYGPRKIWPVSNMNAKPIDVRDTSAAGQRAISLTLGLINSIAGAGGLSEGQPTRGLPRAGFAVSQLLSLGMADTKDIAEAIEYELLTPMLSDLHKLTVMFVPRHQVIQIPGTQDYPPRAVSVAELDGDFEFRWVGSQQAQNQEVRGQKLMVAMQSLAKVEPLLNRQGFEIDWPAVTKMAWREGLGERGVEQIVRPIPPERLMAMQAAQMAGAGGGGQPNAPTSEPEALQELMGMVGGATDGELAGGLTQ